MDIIRTILSQLKQYRMAALLAPVFTLASVGLETLIPYVMALLIDRGIQPEIWARCGCGVPS